METRHSRFKRLALRRTNGIIDRIRVLGNLANKSSYDYSEQEVERMFKAIEEQLRTSKAKFRSKRKFKF